MTQPKLMPMPATAIATRRLRPVAVFAVLAACAVVAHAENWQSYHREGIFVEEMDLDSVAASPEGVRFRYRRHFASGATDSPFEHAVDGMVDCAGRRYGDWKGSRTQLLSVFEGTVSAERVDAACRAAGVATAVAAPAPAASEAAGTARDWRRVDSDALSQAVDARSVQVRDGRVFYTYASAFGRPGQQVVDGVIDCATRQQADVVGGQFALHDINEQSIDGPQATLACGLAGVPTRRRAAAGPDRAWQIYFTRQPIVWELDTNSLRVADGLVHYAWRLRFVEGRPTVSYPVDAVADCAGRRRSDVAFEKFRLVAVDDGSQEAAQVEFACRQSAAK